MQITDSTKKLIELALAEDVGQGDITSQAIIPAAAQGNYAFVAREEMVLCGVALLKYVIASVSEAIQEDGLPRSQSSLAMTVLKKDGDKLKAGEKIATISGNAREILKIERVALNFLQHLSGIATLTSKFAAEIAHTKAQIFDTRKTTPGMRELEKFAVRCGGGQNHRMRLDDMVLIKDNHITAAGGIVAAVAKARNFVIPAQAEILVELEVDNLQQLEQAIAAQPDIIMLDNFSLAGLRQAVQMVNGKILLEASGGVNLQTVRAIAETGVNRISTSKITQSAPAIDIGLDEIQLTQ